MINYKKMITKKNKIMISSAFGLFLLVTLTSIWLSPKGRAYRAEMYFLKAQEELKQNDLISAEKHLRTALELISTRTKYHFALGEVLEKEGFYPEAVESYIKAGELAPRQKDGLFKAGVLEYKMGNKEKALELWEKNIKSFPDHIDTLYQLGYHSARKGDFVNALGFFLNIINIAPSEAEAYNNAGFCYFNLNQFERAKKMFEKALELKPELEQAKKSLLLTEEELKKPVQTP